MATRTTRPDTRPDTASDTGADIASDPPPVDDAPSLQPKRQPSQARARQTYEHILAVAAGLLGELGIERWSTNRVCKAAGLSPPALYQYFPNKYAILRELGERLMARQNALLEPFAVASTFALPEAAFADRVADLFLQTVALTRRDPAGVWVTRALRAVPALQAVRIGSHDAVTERLLAPLLQAQPLLDPRQARLTVRLAIEVLYSGQELLFDDPGLAPEDVARTLARMVAGEFQHLRGRAKPPPTWP